MDISRNFVFIGALYLLVGIPIGMYMGASGDNVLVPSHAHINLLGFVLMTVFGLVYRAWPAMAGSRLAPLHFWFHQIGVLILMVMLALYLLGRIPETAMFPLAPIAELLVLLGIAAFAVNVWRNAG